MEAFATAIENLRYVIFLDGKAVAAFHEDPRSSNYEAGGGYFVDALRDDQLESDIQADIWMRIYDLRGGYEVVDLN